MNPYLASGADPVRTTEYSQLFSGLDLVSGAPIDFSAEPYGLAAQPQLASGLDLVSGGLDIASGGLDLASGLDLVSGADEVAEAIASGAVRPNIMRWMPPVARAAINRSLARSRANTIAAQRRYVNQPRLVDNGPSAYKEQTENLSRTTVAAGNSFRWTFTILGRAAKVTDLILPDGIAEFFDVQSALVGNNNLFHGGGAACGDSFAASARRTGFESDTVPAGSLVTILFQNVDAAPHTLSARCKMKIMY